MKILRNRYFLLLLLFSCLLLTTTFCQKEKITKIGITQIATHPGLDAVREGFITGMTELGYAEGKNLKFIYKNALGQMSLAQTIAQDFVNQNVNLMVPISTPSAQACSKASNTIPIVFAGITDPVGAGLVKSLEKPGANITGVSDVWPYKRQIELLIEVFPKAKRIGMVFNPGESNSVYAMKIIREIVKEKNLALVEVSVSNTNEVLAAAQSLIGRVDALYVAADNTVVEALESMIKVANESKLPLLVGDTGSVERGGLMTYGTNYGELGKTTAKIVDRVIKGEKPGNIPVAVAEKADLYINLKTAAAIGAKIPDQLLAKAAKVIR